MARGSNPVQAFMPWFVADYLRDTMHLTRDQHGGYLLLLAAYWTRGEPLPDDDARLAAITKSTAQEWRKLRPVLAEFFTVSDGVWRSKRADAELEKAANLREKRSAIGKAAVDAREARRTWRQPKDHRQDDPNDDRDDNRTIIPEISISSHIVEEKGSLREPKKKAQEREPNGTRIAEDWQPSPSDVAFAEASGLDAAEAAAEFRDYWRSVPGAKGRKLDWSATFRNSCRMKARPRNDAGNHNRNGDRISNEERKYRAGIAGLAETLRE